MTSEDPRKHSGLLSWRTLSFKYLEGLEAWLKSRLGISIAVPRGTGAALMQPKRVARGGWHLGDGTDSRWRPFTGPIQPYFHDGVASCSSLALRASADDQKYCILA